MHAKSGLRVLLEWKICRPDSVITAVIPLGQSMPWDDLSNHLTHFTKPNGDGSAYNHMISICYEQVLTAASPFGIARRKAPDVQTQNSVCFSEVPLHHLDRISERRSRYGIGFTKEFAKSKGALPVWYVEKDSQQNRILNRLIDSALDSDAPTENEIWQLSPFIDVPGEYYGKPYRFEWEREWRVIGNFSFTPDETAFLIIPEELHETAAGFFRDAERDNTGPAYLCPYIDSNWDKNRVKQALEDNWPHNES